MVEQQRQALLDDIVFQLMRLSTRMVELHKKPKDFGCGVLLFPAEVHTLSAVYQNPQSNMTEIAALLRVTKGAVSQMISKMEAKGLVKKMFAPGSEKQRILRVTEKGMMAHRGHEEYHKRMAIAVEKKMQSLSLKDIKKYREINKMVEELIEELR